VRTLRQSKWQIFTKISFPARCPTLRDEVAAVLAVASAIVGEFLGSEKAWAT
jgi:NitT/TauT family transport system permease protein